MTNKKSGLLLDASGLPSSPHGIVVRSLKTYAVCDLEVSTDAQGPLELLTNAQDPFAATIVAVAIELERRDEKITALGVELSEISRLLQESHNRISELAADLRVAVDQVETNRLGVNVAQRAAEVLMIESGKLK
jgi:hypothetical protein